MEAKKKDWRVVAYQLGAVLLVLGAVSPFLGGLYDALSIPVGALLYLFGAVLFLLAFISSPVKSISVRQRRIYRMNVLTGAFFLVSALLRLWRTDALWMIFMGIAVVYMIYAMILLVSSNKLKEKNEQEKQ